MIAATRREALDRDRLAILAIGALGAVHHAHAAATDLFHNAEWAETRIRRQAITSHDPFEQAAEQRPAQQRAWFE